MSHLKIEQNTSSVEVISSTIIDKLYKLALSGTLDSSSNLKGNLLVAHAYEDAVTYLTTNYANLLINVTGGAYIRFADTEVLIVLIQHGALNNQPLGDGTGITTINALTLVQINNSLFLNNTTITSFDELIKFTNVLSIYDSAFGGCSNLTSIRLDGITQITQNAFANCTKLVNLGSTSKVTILGPAAFASCAFTSINLYNCTSIGNSAFYGCNKLETIGHLSKISSIGDNSFYRCLKLRYLYIDNEVIPAIVSNALSSSNPFIYVPATLKSSYLSDSSWSVFGYLIDSIGDYTNINPPTILEGYYINSNGNLVVNSDYTVTDYIACPSSTSITIVHRMASEYTACFIEYDSNKNKINNWVGEDGIRTITTHPNTAYIRISLKTDLLSKGYSIYNNSTKLNIMKVHPLSIE